MSCGVGCRCGSDLALPWLWCRREATAPIRPVAWEPPYAVGVALKERKTNKQTNKTRPKKRNEVLAPDQDRDTPRNLLSKGRWVGRTTQCMLPFIRNDQNEQVQGDGRQIGDCLGPGVEKWG